MPEWVGVQTQGVGVWLGMEISRRLDIWSNVYSPYPRAMIEKIFSLVLGDACPDTTLFEPGRLTWSVMGLLPEVMGLPATQVAAVATFYTMLNKEPVGRHLIQVCTNIACSLLGAEHLVEHIRTKLGIGVGETTPDGKFTLLEVECLGSCGTAPIMQIGDRYYEDLTEEKIDRILAELD